MQTMIHDYHKFMCQYICIGFNTNNMQWCTLYLNCLHYTCIGLVQRSIWLHLYMLIICNHENTSYQWTIITGFCTGFEWQVSTHFHIFFCKLFCAHANWCFHCSTMLATNKLIMDFALYIILWWPLLKPINYFLSHVIKCNLYNTLVALK